MVNYQHTIMIYYIEKSYLMTHIYYVHKHLHMQSIQTLEGCNGLDLLMKLCLKKNAFKVNIMPTSMCLLVDCGLFSVLFGLRRLTEVAA